MKRRIVEAAADEFASAGYTGARIERIAEAADCNRSLIYFYFGSKAGLFEAALDDAAQHREKQMAGQPSTLTEGLIYWFRQNMAEPRRIRLIMQEALAPSVSDAFPQGGRKHYLERQLQLVKAFQAAGLIRTDFDPQHLLTLFLAITSFPACFPKVAAVSLGAENESDMLDRWSAGIAHLAELLAPGDAPPETS